MLPTDGNERNAGHHAAGEHKSSELAGGQPRCGRPKDVGHISRHYEDDGARHDYRIHPEIPRREKACHFAEPGFCPLIEAAFQRHHPVQINYDHGERHVKKQHGAEPERHVSAAQLGRDTDPSRTYNAQYLGHHQVKKPKFSTEAGLFDGCGSGHGHP